MSEPRLIKRDKVEIKSIPDTLPVKKGSLSEKKIKWNQGEALKPTFLQLEAMIMKMDFFTERDSFNIVKKAVSFNDAITVQMCYAAGVSIHFDDTIENHHSKGCG